MHACYIGYSRENFMTCYQHFDAYFDKILYNVPGRMLNMLAPELAPIVHAIFTQSLDTGELPRDWSLANVAPIFKKGNRVLAENYRPVSLTCITCKLFEHIVCRHILDHVEDHKILQPPTWFSFRQKL